MPALRTTQLLLAAVLPLLLLLMPTMVSGQASQPAPELGPPPAVGAVILDDPLTQAGALRDGPCPTGYGRRQFVPDGFLLQVEGKCTDYTLVANVGNFVPGLIVPDGELRLELEFVNSTPRARFNPGFR